jgi:hypothetical protein
VAELQKNAVQEFPQAKRNAHFMPRRFSILTFSVWAGAVSLLTLASALLFADDLLIDKLDYLKTPAASSPKSRWYSLEELGIRPGALRSEMRVAAISATPSYSNALDLRDHECFPKLELLDDRQTIANSEPWEDGIGPGKDKVGYPSVVQNTHGEGADNRFYLFYAIHDPYSGIAAATADKVDGPWTKVGAGGVSQPDSRVLRAPKRPRITSHYSSPVVLWNESEQLWFMYFHFYSNEWDAGRGHQRTALATSRSLAARDWKPWVDEDGKLIVVMPVVPERWMNSQSSYHAIYKLPGKYWLAFLRGTGGLYSPAHEWQQDTTALGLAVSLDGRKWAQLPGNPLLHPKDGHGGKAGVYRPQFVALLGDRYLFTWAESDYYDSGTVPVAGYSTDLEHIDRASINFPGWSPADGAVPAWRANDVIHLFYGNRQRAYRMLPGCQGATAPQEK